MSRSDFMTSNVPSHYGKAAPPPSTSAKMLSCTSNVVWARARADAHGCRVRKSSLLDSLLPRAKSTRRRATLPRTISLHLSLTLDNEVHMLAPHDEGPRRVSRTERLGSVRSMHGSGLDNRITLTKPSGRRESASRAKPLAPRASTL